MMEFTGYELELTKEVYGDVPIRPFPLLHPERGWVFSGFNVNRWEWVVDDNGVKVFESPGHVLLYGEEMIRTENMIREIESHLREAA